MPITRNVCCKPARSPHGGWMLQCPGVELCSPPSPKDPVCLPNSESFHSGFIWHVFCSSDWFFFFLRILAARWSWGSANPSCVNSPKWRLFFLLKIRRRALSLSFPVVLTLVGGLQDVRGPPPVSCAPHAHSGRTDFTHPNNKEAFRL